MSHDWLATCSDDDLRTELKAIDDDDDIRVTVFEAKFIEDVAFKRGLTMTVKQRNLAKQLIRKYR